MLRSLALPRRWLLWIAAGLVLRLLFIYFPRPVDDDFVDYLQMGHNLLHSGVYGMGSGSDLFASMYRLPAYPVFLAVFELIFARLWPGTWLNAVFLVQTVIDLASCLLLAAFARRFLSDRAAEVTLALAMLCPITAVYAATAMTECLSIFAIALGIYAAGRALAAESSGRRDLRALLLAGAASALAMLLRPDGAALPAAIALGLFLYTFRARASAQPALHALRRSLAATTIFCCAALLPLVPWTIRNWVDFHTFQPLAPRYGDPGEQSIAGARRWLRTWTVEFVSTANVCWNFPGDTIDLADLPPRAFDSPQQREQTLALIAEYNQTRTLTPQLVDGFAALADRRIHDHPFRYYVTLPLLRVADMLFRPRTIEYDLDVFWWRWSEHPADSAWAILLGLINLFYVAAAAWAFLRRRVPWPALFAAYLVLRFLVIGAMENPEPRYTVQCFPIFIVAAAAALTRSRRFSVSPPAS
ncbi:MAG: glycosyltransferase family 39 protein [Terracidiphilus sp.]|jgi:4-amino-4-deoxy-L-arabinose transferase-like glycosyltransferase